MLSLGDKSQQKARNDFYVSQLSESWKMSTEKKIHQPLEEKWPCFRFNTDSSLSLQLFFFFVFFLLLLEKTLQKKTFSELIQ